MAKTRTNAVQVTYKTTSRNPQDRVRKSTKRPRGDNREQMHGPYAKPQMKRADRVPGSPTTVDEQFNASQYNPDPAVNANQQLGNQNWEKNFDDDPSEDFEQYLTPNQSKIAQVFLNIHDSKKVATKAERSIQTAKIIEICVWIYPIQGLFWLLSIAGVAIESQIFTDMSLPGTEMIYVGMIGAALTCWAQLLVAAVIYHIDPFSSKHDVYFFCAASLCWAPIVGGFWPWVLLWIYDINFSGQK